jgi:uncharacterized lipoprotein
MAGCKEQCTAITGYELAADYATIWREVGEDTHSLKLEVMRKSISRSSWLLLYSRSKRNEWMGLGLNTPTFGRLIHMKK